MSTTGDFTPRPKFKPPKNKYNIQAPKNAMLIPMEQWEKPNGVYRAVAHAVTSAEAFRIAQGEARTAQDITRRMAELLGRYPNMSHDMSVAFAKLGIEPGSSTAESAAKYDMLAQQVKGYDGTQGADPASIFKSLDALGKKPETADPKDMNDSRFFSGFKGMTRTVTAGLFAPLQMVTQYARTVVANVDKASEGNRNWLSVLSPTKNVYENTYLWQMHGENKESGQGYFPDYNSAAVRASEQIARDTLTVKGRNDLAWTLGRGIADIFFDPESTAFRTMSGVIDATVAIIADPMILAGRGLTVAKASKNVKGAVAAAKSSKTALADADTAARQSKRITDAEALRKVMDEDVANMKQTIAEDLFAKHELSVLGKGTITPAEATAIGAKLDIPALRAEYDTLAATVDQLKNIKSAPDVAVAAKAAGLSFKSGATTDDIIKSVDRRYRTQLKLQRAKSDEIVKKMGEVYGDELAPQMALLAEAKSKYLQQVRFGETLSKQMEDIDQARKIVEGHRAGVKVLPSESILEREKAIKWFAGPNAQHFLQAMADTDSAAFIHRLSKGKFSPELAHNIAMAKTVQEVEDVLLPRIGLSVDRLSSGRNLPNYLISRYPNLVLRGANSTRLNNAYDKLNQVFKHPFVRMPNGRYMHFEDTDTLVEQTSRWMSSAGFKQDEIDNVFNELVSTNPLDVQARRKIILNVLDNAVQNVAKSEKLSPTSLQNLSENIKAYGNNLYNEGVYHSNVTAHTNGFKVILGPGEEVDLTGTPLSVTQLTQGIRLPDVVEIKRATSNISRAARSLDRMVGDGQVTEQFARNAMRAIRGANNFFKTNMLFARPAFIARDIMECVIRQFLSGGRTIVTSPRTMLATIVSNPLGAKKMLSKIDRGIGKYDPYKVDASGNAFHAQNYKPGIDQEFMNSHQQMMSNRAVSSDGRMITYGVTPDANWALDKLADNKGNVTRYSDALAGQILRHYGDPMRRTMASWIAGGKPLPKSLQKQVDAGKITFEDAFSRMVHENRFKGVEILRNSTPEMRRVLEHKKGRMEFLFDHENSVKNQLLNDTLGMTTLLDFIGTGKMIDSSGKVIFEVSSDFAKNHRNLSRIIRKNLIENDTMAKRAMDVSIPTPMRNNETLAMGRKLVDGFFDIAARSTTRTIYSPEYRIKYWDASAEFAPLLTQEAAQKLLSSAFGKEIMKTKVVDSATGKAVNYTSKNPAFKKLVEVAQGKHPGGFLSVEEMHSIASERAAKHVANLFYDAAEKSNLAHAASLILPFVNAWQNTIRTWGKYSISPARAAQRMTPFARMMQTLQSPDSRTIYELTGTPTDATDPNEGFIYTDQNGNKRFTVPFSGGLMSAFGLLGDTRMGNIGVNLQSLNLAFSGGALPGSDVGLAPGVGPLITVGYRRAIPQSWKYAMPPIIRDIIEPYGPQRTSNVLEEFAAGWQRNFLFAADQQNITKFSKGIMGYLASTDDKYSSLWDQQTSMSAGDRAGLQADLAEKAGNMAIGMIMWQSFVKALSPGAPVYTWYQKAKGGQSMSQIQLAHAFNEIYDQVNGDYNVAFGQFTDIFGPQAVMSMLSTSTNDVMGTSEAFDFARQHEDLRSKYAKELPYFFTGGDYSLHYAALLKARGESNALSRKDLIREADAAMIAAMKGQLFVKAAKYGYGPDWVDDEMVRMKANLFPGYSPERPKTANDRENRIARVIEMSKDPRILETNAGKGLQEWLPMYVSVKKQATDAGYKSVGVDEFVAEREMLQNKAEQIAASNPDFGNLYRRVFYYEING